MQNDSKEIQTSVVSIFISNMICVVYWPLDILKTRKQTFMNESKFGRNYQGIYKSIKQLQIEEGIRGMYRGWQLQSVQSFSYSLFIQFQQSAKSRQKQLQTQNTLGNINQDQNHILQFQINLEAALLTTMCVQPIWVFKTRMQLLNYREQTNPSTFIQNNIMTKKGIVNELQSGFRVSLLLSVSGSIRFFIQDMLNHHFRTSDKQDSAIVAANAVLAKVTATTIFQPLELIRSRIMDQDKNNKSIIQNLKYLIQNEKLVNFYNGQGFNLVKNIPIQITMFLFQEKIKTYVKSKI